MVWTLSRTFLLSARRRAARAGAAYPVAAAGALLAALALPALSFWSGVRADDALHSAIDVHPGAAHDAAAVLALGAAMAGVLVASVAPRRELLGAQLLPAPLPRAVATVALTLVPVALLLSAAAVPAALFLVPITGPAAPAGLAALGCSLAAGAAIAETVVAVARRAVRGVAFAALAAAVLLAGPVDVLAGSLRGETSAAVFPFAVVALAGWGICAAFRPEAPGSRGVVHVCARGVVTAAFARYARHGRLRVNALAAVAFASLGAAVLLAAGFDASTSATLASLTSVVGAAMIPLATPGIDRRAAWLWRSVPARAGSLFLRGCIAALAWATLVAAVGIALASVVAPAPPSVLASAAAAAAVVFGCALMTGTPARGGTGGELMLLSAFAAVTAMWSFALGHIASAVGAERGAAAILLAAVSLAATVAAAAVLDARGAR
jgi:hypothetical protein